MFIHSDPFLFFYKKYWLYHVVYKRYNTICFNQTLLTDTKLIDPNLDYVIHLNTLKVHFFFGEENFLDLLGRVSRIS